MTATARAAPAAAMLALAAAAWSLTAERMDGMGMGPGADLGSAGWFAATWLLMTAAMMLPALVPAAPGGRRAAAFALGYLGAWTAAGLAVYPAYEAVRGLGLGGGRYVAAGVILAAAAYQFTGGKERCLERCRRARTSALAERPGVVDGLLHGASCLGCCVGLMAALFALGLMSLTWMAVVAALIVVERLLPWRKPAIYGTAAALTLLGVLVLAAGPF